MEEGKGYFRNTEPEIYLICLGWAHPVEEWITCARSSGHDHPASSGSMASTWHPTLHFFNLYLLPFHQCSYVLELGYERITWLHSHDRKPLADITKLYLPNDVFRNDEKGTLEEMQ